MYYSVNAGRDCVRAHFWHFLSKHSFHSSQEMAPWHFLMENPAQANSTGQSWRRKRTSRWAEGGSVFQHFRAVMMGGVQAQPLISHTLVSETSICHDLYIYEPHMVYLHYELCRVWFSVILMSSSNCFGVKYRIRGTFYYPKSSKKCASYEQWKSSQDKFMVKS